MPSHMSIVNIVKYVLILLLFNIYVVSPVIKNGNNKSFTSKIQYTKDVKNSATVLLYVILHAEVGELFTNI